MSANFYELLKYAATGIASPDMTYFDRIRASTLIGGSVQTLTGIPPLTFKADGTPLISWSMKGNGSQTGTPTPDAPIMPEFCGVRTGNLFDGQTEAGIYLAASGNKYGNYTNGMRSANKIPVSSETAYTLSCHSDIQISLRILEWNGGTFVTQTPKYNITGDVYITVTTNASTTQIAFNIEGENGQYAKNIMLNLGTTALPYEPYGWAEKITCAGQTVPVYLGQTQTVRRIKKLVLTGEEDITSTHTDVGLFNIPVTDYLKIASTITNICSHYRAEINANGWSDVTDLTCRFYGNAGSSSKLLYIRDSSFSTVDDFKSYLTQQYQNGTPVTVWYVLATEQTAIVNEPLAKIGDYCDELHSMDAGVSIPTAKGQNVLAVETELQPSSVSLTGGIK